MNVETKNGIVIYTPRSFEDIFEITNELAEVTKCVIIDCSYIRVLPSRFISVAINKKHCVVLVGISYTAANIFKTINVDKDIVVRDSIEAAIKCIEGKV